MISNVTTLPIPVPYFQERCLLFYPPVSRHLFFENGYNLAVRNTINCMKLSLHAVRSWYLSNLKLISRLSRGSKLVLAQRLLELCLIMAKEPNSGSNLGNY